jgi:hypothetical protein
VQHTGHDLGVDEISRATQADDVEFLLLAHSLSQFDDVGPARNLHLK